MLARPQRSHRSRLALHQRQETWAACFITLPTESSPLSSLLNRSPQPSSLLSSPALHITTLLKLLIQGLSASTTSCCQLIIYGQGWLYPALSAHSHPFTTTHSLYSPCMSVCVCVHLWLSECEHTCTSVCILCITCLACLLKLLFWMEVGVLWRPVPCDSGGNKVRLSNLFRRHSLLRESVQPPHSTTSTLISHSIQFTISQQPSVKGSVV